ncbi:MAG: hypothetical protein FWE67_10360 [Planctomycetaceae bacterium]|nr:hypothetical protein [Planctomycetaceae bacterium]
MSTESIRHAAGHFLENETPFHLGEMLTEQSHPVTKTLSQTLEKDTAAGLELLLRVDDDLPPVVDKVITSPEFQKLRTDIYETLRSGSRIFFSGCGATGRLSILLDASHRRFCFKAAAKFPEHRDFFTSLAEQTGAIMTGGDFALIRSVEYFEDYITFGKRQVSDAGLTQNDCLVAISEGGETSSVIGTIHGALDLGCKTHFMFNNPAELLIRKVERSRNVIVDSRVNVLDLAAGPMAVAGSTRMQATTMEHLIAGLAFECALYDFLEERLPESVLQTLVPSRPSPEEGAKHFRRLLECLRLPENIRALAAWVDFEKNIYAASGLITYFPDEYMLDVFTDTTERSPTFMIPPFRSTLEPENPVSWAFVKDPLRETDAAWRNILGHEPRCIAWTPEDYRTMGAAERIIANPPKIDRQRLSTYCIGNEPDASRTAVIPNVAVAFLVGLETAHLASGDEWYRAFDRISTGFEKRAVVLFGSQRPHANPLEEICFIETEEHSSPLEVFTHLAVKLALNNVSTAVMGKLGRLNGNWMAHVDASNKKLIDRSIRLVSELANVDYKTACYALFESLDELSKLPEGSRKTISPAAYTVKKLA